MVSVETVLFVEKLNALAKKTSFCSKLFPFSCFSEEEMEKYGSTALSRFVFYDDKCPVTSVKGVTYYPVAQDMVVDEIHRDIVGYDGHVFVCVPDTEDIEPYLVAFPKKVNEMEKPLSQFIEREVRRTCFIVEDGRWYSV